MRIALFIFSALVLAATTILASAPGTSADHNDSEPGADGTFHGGSAVGSWWKVGPGGEALPNISAFPGDAVPAIVRNLVTLNTSKAIPVCATGEYAAATQQAIGKWNTALSGSTVRGKDIFRYEPGGVLCNPSTSGELKGIVVYETREGVDGEDCDPGGVACWQARYLTAGPNYTYFGVAAVLFDEADFDGITQAIWNRGPLRNASEAERRATVLGHEFGHALGLRHGWEAGPGVLPKDVDCTDNTSGTPQSLEPGIIHQGPCSAQNVGSYDKRMYKHAYIPGKVPTSLAKSRA